MQNLPIWMFTTFNYCQFEMTNTIEISYELRDVLIVVNMMSKNQSMTEMFGNESISKKKLE